MRSTVRATFLFAGLMAAAAPLVAAPKPPAVQYHFGSLGNKGDYQVSLSDDGLAGGHVRTTWQCGGSTARRYAAVWDATNPTGAPEWGETLPAGCEYCYSQMDALGTDGSWGVGGVCDPEDGPSADGCHCTKTQLVVWNRDGTSPVLSFVRAELGDPVPALPGEPGSLFTGAATIGSQRIGILRDQGLLRETSPDVWDQEAYSFGGSRWSINDMGIAAGNVWDGDSRTYRPAVWDCTVTGCSDAHVFLDYSSTGGVRYRINASGDIVGATVFWRYKAPPSPPMSWDPVELLPVPTIYRSCEAYASERVGGKIIAVGVCFTASAQYAVRWTSPQPPSDPPVWTGPEKIETLDDGNANVKSAHDINTSGMILGWYGRVANGCVEIPR